MEKMEFKKLKLVSNNTFLNRKHNEGYKDFACDICKNKEVIEVPYARKYTDGQVIHICKICGLVYVKLRRSYHKVAKVWSKELFRKTYTSKTPLMLARHTYVAEFIEQNVGLKNKKVCDVGAGEGQFLNIIKNVYGASVFGIEPSKNNCDIMKRSGIQCFNGTLEDYANSAKRNFADIVTMMWTVENSASPRTLLQGIRPILKNNGRLVVATGSRILVPFSKPLHLYLSSNPVDTHAVRFSINTLTSFLATGGFEVIDINPYLNDSFVLCIIAKKVKINKNLKIKRDDFRDVRDFFKRWHKETLFYKKEKNTVQI